MAKYRAGVIGLGWMGLLYDLAERTSKRFEIDDVRRPTPELDVHRTFHHHEHPGDEGLPTSYAEALWDRPDMDLVAGSERDPRRRSASDTQSPRCMPMQPRCSGENDSTSWRSPRT